MASSLVSFVASLAVSLMVSLAVSLTVSLVEVPSIGMTGSLARSLSDCSALLFPEAEVDEEEVDERLVDGATGGP